MGRWRVGSGSGKGETGNEELSKQAAQGTNTFCLLAKPPASCFPFSPRFGVYSLGRGAVCPSPGSR
jgi:hypothetical protein